MKLLLALVAVVLLSGCTSAPAPRPTITAGQDAASIAAQIPGCRAVTAEAIGNGDLTGLVSAASCVLGGHKVFVDSFKSASEADLKPVVEASGAEACWAAGRTWVVILGDDPTMQEQITNDAAALLKQGFSGPAPAPNLDAAKRAATAAAQALGGKVVHVRP